MGDLFSSKTKSTSTSKTQVPQNFQNFLNMSLNKAASAGNQGFTRYEAPRIAELSSNEQAGITGAGAQAGMYQPVINMALQANQDMFNNATPDATPFINPYVNYVLGNSLDRLQEQSDTNMTKIGSSAAMSGAFGGLRHGVLEGANLAELLKSARDLSGSTYADAYDKGMNNWFRTQDNQRANIGDALNIVRSGQGYNTQDIQNLMSTGLTERTRNQAGLDFGYSEFLREDQDDLNKASFLSTIAAQYPRDLFTRSNTTETTQMDSPIKTLAGIGIAAAGIMSGNPAALAGLGAGAQATGAPTNIVPPANLTPSAPQPFNPSWYNRGGLVKRKGYADGGVVKAGNSPLEDTIVHLARAKANDTDFGWGGFLSGGWLFGEAEDRMKSKKPQQEQDVSKLSISQRPQFNLDEFMRSLNLSSFTKPSMNTVNPNYSSGFSLPQGLGQYTPMRQQMQTSLAFGVPGPGGPTGLGGNTLMRPSNQAPQQGAPLEGFAKGGKVEDPWLDVFQSPNVNQYPELGPLGDLSALIQQDRFIRNIDRYDSDLDRKKAERDRLKRSLETFGSGLNLEQVLERERKEELRKAAIQRAEEEKRRQQYRKEVGPSSKINFQDGGMVKGGKGFNKSQERLPPDYISPLDSLIYGMPRKQDALPEIDPSKIAGRKDALQSGPSTQATSFDSFEELFKSIPKDPSVERLRKLEAPTAGPLTEAQRYTKSRMWDGVNEDVFIEGTKINEQDNRASVKNKNLSKNDADPSLGGTHAFTQFQFTEGTWNSLIKKIPKEVKDRLNIKPVYKKDIYKYKSGDEALAKFLPSPEAAAYVYKTHYLPNAYNKLKRANIPVTEMNLYLAHHLGPDGAIQAIPSLYNNEDKPMRKVLKDVGLTSAANSKGNPWTKTPGLTFAQYRAQKERAYEDIRDKYRGLTLEELQRNYQTADLPNDRDPEPFDMAVFGDRTKAPAQDYRDVMRELLLDTSPGRNEMRPKRGKSTRDPLAGPETLWGGARFANGGLVKNFDQGGGVTLRMPEKREDWEEKEPSWFDKVFERIHDPKGVGFGMDDVASTLGLTGDFASSSGKVPTNRVVLPLGPAPDPWSRDPDGLLGPWGPKEDPVDAFYNEMEDMTTLKEDLPGPLPQQQQEMGSPTEQGGSSPQGIDDDPEKTMLEQLYRDRLKDYLSAQQKPKKKAVFGMFDDVNEPLLKLGLSLLASKGSFGEALGEAGLSSLEDRDKEQMKQGQEASDKLQEILKMRYTNAMIESMDPNVKAQMAREAQAARSQDQKEKLEVEREKAGLTGKQTRLNRALNYLLSLRERDENYKYSEEQLQFLRDNGIPITNPEDKGPSLFD